MSAATSETGPRAGSRKPVDLRSCMADPLLDVMDFLNEVMLRYPEAISFAAGRPPEDLFDVRRTVDGIAHYLSSVAPFASDGDPWNALGGYNRTNGIIGELIAKQLAIDEDIHVASDAIMVTVGAQEAMAVVLMGLFEPRRDILLTSDPTYVGITALARLLGIRVVPVPTGDAGIDPAVAERLIASASRDGRVRGLYDIPDFNNPLGTRLSIDRRHALIDVCRRHDVLLIEDNPYGMFVYDGARLPTLKALDRAGTVLYIGSFSKTLFPALRLGYLVADQQAGTAGRPLAAELSRVKSVLTVNSSTVVQAMAAGALLRSGGSLEPLVREKRCRLHHRRDVLLRCLTEAFGRARQVTWNKPEGGYFVTVSLPFDFGVEELQCCAADYGVIACPMRFFTLGDARARQIRLSFSYLDDAEIREGIERLARFIETRGTPCPNDAAPAELARGNR